MKSKIAMAFGSFDILHPGHVRYLRGASRYGKLIVVVARDKSIEKLKGRRPLIDEESRREMVGSLGFVDRAVLGDRIGRWNDIYRILIRYKPDFVVFGYDQKVDMKYLKRFLMEHKLNSRIVRIKAYKSGLYKSSKLKRLMKTTC